MMFCVQSALYCVQSALFCVQSALFCVQSALYCVQSALYCVQSALYCVQSALFYQLPQLSDNGTQHHAVFRLSKCVFVGLRILLGWGKQWM